MTLRTRIRRAVLLVLALLLVPSAIANADQAYDEVAQAFAQSGGQLDPCSFTQAQLESAIAGIPPQIRSVVPDLRRAMQAGVKAHEQGRCKGRKPGTTTSSGAVVPPTSSTPATSPAAPPATTPDAGTPTTPSAGAPATTPTTPSTTTPSAAAPATSTASAGGGSKAKPWLVAAVAVGVVLLALLLLWGWARMRGWDPTWTKRMRHAWGEAGYRTTSTWSEFTDWLRLGR